MHVVCLTWSVLGVFYLQILLGGTSLCGTITYVMTSSALGGAVWVQVGCGCVAWWTHLALWVKGLIVTVLQNFVNLTLCQLDREQTWVILCCGLPLERSSGLRFLLHKTMGLGLPLFKFQSLGSIYVEQVAI